jgi:Cu/Zn superoxide dismutase
MLTAAALAFSAALFAAPLTDLQPATAGPFDHARARLVVAEHHGSTTFVLLVTGADRAVAGTTYGAHLHVGPCVPGQPALAGPHYNSTGQPPTAVNDHTEVWLDFTVNAAGIGTSVTTVPFVPAAGERAVVIHAEPTSPTGTAGARQACLPVTLS